MPNVCLFDSHLLVCFIFPFACIKYLIIFSPEKNLSRYNRKAVAIKESQSGWSLVGVQSGVGEIICLED